MLVAAQRVYFDSYFVFSNDVEVGIVDYSVIGSNELLYRPLVFVMI